MRKLILASTCALMLGLATVANAQTAGGFTGPSIAPITVKEAKKLSDDRPVSLVGRIEKSLGGEKYLFKDDTDSVIIEIDNEDWQGLSVGANELVEIRGEVDRDFRKFKIDVDTIIKK